MAKPIEAGARLLLVADDESLCVRLAGLLAGHGPVSRRGPDLVHPLLSVSPDLRLVVVAEPADDGLETLDLVEEIHRRCPAAAVLVLSSHPTIEHATEAIRRGAEDFLPIPFSEDVLCKTVGRILEAAELRERVDSLDRMLAASYGFDRLVSRSPRMREVFDRAVAASASQTPVLITGETGTGKELIARAIHANSRRATRPFVPINCAALPPDLVESELFGHRRGAFTGAVQDHAGLFVAAHRGTLLLDEIGELPVEAQAKLLRVLQDGEVRPIGSLDSRRVDVRILAATNRPLVSLREGRMRQDLFYRLSVLVIEVPPLRDRLEDLPLLVGQLLDELRGRGGTRVARLGPGALAALATHAFPGNVRELQNLLEGIAASLPRDRTVITAGDVRARLRAALPAPAPPAGEADVPLRFDALEVWAIGEALRRTRGNKRRAAALLGISRDTLYRRLRELDGRPGVPDSLT